MVLRWIVASAASFRRLRQNCECLNRIAWLFAESVFILHFLDQTSTSPMCLWTSLRFLAVQFAGHHIAASSAYSSMLTLQPPPEIGKSERHTFYKAEVISLNSKVAQSKRDTHLNWGPKCSLMFSIKKAKRCAKLLGTKGSSLCRPLSKKKN